MRLDEQPGEGPARRSSAPAAPGAAKGRETPKRNTAPAARGNASSAGNSAMSDALAAALGKKR